jgi:ABC-2 type transport system permease protein
MSELRDTFVIARREFTERARSKWFVLITLLGPVGMAALVIAPSLLVSNPAGSRVDIIDRTAGSVLQTPLETELTKLAWRPTVLPADTAEQAEMDKIRDKRITGFLSIPPGALDGDAILYRGDNGSSPVVKATLQRVVRQAVQSERGKRAKLTPEQLADILTPTNFETQQTNGKSEAASGDASFLIGYALAYILFLVIAVYAVAVMRSVVQEKTSRVMELMVATVKPRSLMAGKILGVGGAGLIQVAVWLTIGALTLAYREQILGALGAARGGPALPSMTIFEVATALAFFVLGFFFYASLYAAAGAMVSSEQDTQQVQMPITLLLIIGFATVTAVSGDPRGLPATVLTILPFWSALLMPMRLLLGGATPGEVVISLAVLAGSTVLIASAAAKIYRVGVLMYGKRPSPKELLRWLRY